MDWETLTFQKAAMKMLVDTDLGDHHSVEPLLTDGISHHVGPLLAPGDKP